MSHIQKSFYRKLPMLAGICLCMYFTYHTMQGERSLSKLNNLVQISHEKESELKILRQSSDNLEKKVHMLRPDTLSVDLLEEQARLVLGYYGEGELVVLHR